MLTKRGTQVLEEVKTLLSVWLNEKQLASDSISKAVICGKAKKLESGLVHKNPSTSAAVTTLKPLEGGWINSASDAHGVLRHGKAPALTRLLQKPTRKHSGDS